MECQTPRCHTPLEPDDSFCPVCGKPVPKTVAAEPPAEPAHSEAAAPPMVPLEQILGDQPPALPPPPDTPVVVAKEPAVADDVVATVPVADAGPQAPFWAEPRAFKPDQCPNCKVSADRIDPSDGVCSNCSVIAIFPVRDDYSIEYAPNLVVRSNLGKVHERDEDFDLVGAHSGVQYMIVCDGLSTSQNPHLASEGACRAGIEVMRQAALAGEAPDGVMVKMVEAAQAAVLKVPLEAGREDYDRGMTTLTAAYVKDGVARLAYCGDSRIYVIRRGKEGGYKAQLVSNDQSYVHAVAQDDKISIEEAYAKMAGWQAAWDKMVAGELTLEQAFPLLGPTDMSLDLAQRKLKLELITLPDLYKKLSPPGVHTMVQCLGPVPAGDKLEPVFSQVSLEDVVCLFCCSDGVWNDAHVNETDEPVKFAEVFTAVDGNPMKFAQAMVDFANQCGGHDNSTIAVLTFPETHDEEC